MYTRRQIIVGSIITSVNELGYRVRDKEELPRIVQELVSTCREFDEELEAVEQEENRNPGQATRKQRLAYIIRNYRRSNKSLTEVEFAIRPGGKRLQQDEIIAQIIRIKDSLDNIREVIGKKERVTIPIDRLPHHISDLYENHEETKLNGRLLARISKDINNGSQDFRSLPRIVAGLMARARQGENRNCPVADRVTETQHESIGFVIEPDARQLQAEVGYLEEQLETLRNSMEEKQHQAENERRSWATEGEQHRSEMINLRREFEEMEQRSKDELASLEARCRQNIVVLNTEHGKTIAEMQEAHDNKLKELRDDLDYNGKVHDKAVKKLQNDHSAKEKELEESVAQANTHHQTTVQRLRNEHHSTITQMQTSHEAKKTHLEREHRELEGELRTQRDTWKGKHAKEVKNAKEALQQHKDRLDENHKNEKNQIEAKHKQQISITKRQHEAALETSATTHAQRTAELQSKFEAEQHSLTAKIKQLQEDLQRAKGDTERVEKDLKAKTLKQMRFYEKEMQTQQEANEEANAAQQKLHEEATAAQTELHEEELRRLSEAQQTELSSQREKFANLLAKADTRHEDRKQELLVLQGRLQKRDNHVALTDSEIVEGRIDDSGDLEVHGMATLLAEVKKFAAWSWRDEREIWPQDVMFALAGDKQKRLRKLILGDMIWTELFHAVFCSPFRLLGDVGKKLEHDWSQNFGEGIGETANSEYIWPRATLDSEKWRYDTCQDALRSLTKPTTEFSDDGRLKKSFFNNRKVIRTQLFESVGRLVELDNEQKGELDVFILNAVRTWLCFGTQRYRLQLFMTGSADLDQEKKMDLVQKENLMFTVAPRLRRIGNSRGTELDEVCTVSGCAGSQESARFPK